MQNSLGRQAFVLLLAVAAGCGDDGRTTSAQIKDASHDAAQGAKAVGSKVSAELAEACDSLELWAKETASDVDESGDAFAKRVQDKMPDTEKLVEGTKEQLAAGGAKAKELGARLDEKLATLKSKLGAVAQSAASATKEMKDDVVDAYDDLLAEVRGALSPKAG